MPAVVTFDPSTYRIVEIDTGLETNAISIVEVYSEWKAWALLGDNAKHPPAFRAVGGDPIDATRSVGVTVFLREPWKIRPAEYDHRLVLTGNLAVDPAGRSPLVPTLGGHTVLAEIATSNLFDRLAFSIENPAPTAAEIADAVWDEALAEHLAAGSSGRTVTQQLALIRAVLGLSV